MGPLRRLREIALFVVLVAVAVLAAGWITRSFDRLAHEKAGGVVALDTEGAPRRPPSSAGVAVRWNGIAAQRWLLPVPTGASARDLEQLLERSAAWSAPLFPGEEAAVRMPFGRLADGAQGSWELVGERGRCKVAMVVRSGTGSARLLLLRTRGDAVVVVDERAELRTKVEAPAGLGLPEGSEPVYSVESVDGRELALWCRTDSKRDSLRSWRTSLVEAGWTETLVAGSLHSYRRGPSRCDLILDAEAGADSLAQLRVYTDDSGHADPHPSPLRPSNEG